MIWCKGFTDIRRCKLCQDTSAKGVGFRKQFGLDTIPECPFKKAVTEKRPAAV